MPSNAQALKAYLDTLPAQADTKRAAWNAVSEASDPVVFQKQLDVLPLSKAQKRALWDLGVSESSPDAQQPKPMNLSDEVAQDVEAAARWGRGLVGGLKASIPFAGYEQTDEPGAMTGRVLGEVAQLLSAGPVVKAGVKALSAVPMVVKGAQSVASIVPSAERAGQKFQTVMAAAKDMPIDISGPGNVALRIQQLSERGASMPKVVRDFLKRATDPEKGEIAYQEARDFASNISRLSSQEFSKLTPVVANEVHKLRIALNKSVEMAARQAGKSDEYLSAMKEYAQAAKLRKAWDTTKKAVTHYALPAGAIGWSVDKVADAIRGR